MKKIYILLVAIFAISSTSCSDYLDSDYIFEDRETIDKVFTDYKKTEQWLAQAYTYLLGQCCDVASKRNTPFVFDDCMYYGDDDVEVYTPTVNRSQINLDYNSVKEHTMKTLSKILGTVVIMVFDRLLFSSSMQI